MSGYLQQHIERPVHFHELWECNDWKVKIYTIIQPGVQAGFNGVGIAKNLAIPLINAADGNDRHHASAFIIIHLAEAFHQILFDYWAHSNELRQRVYRSEPRDVPDFRDVTATGELFCVWELGVIAFEREVWMEHVLKEQRPNLTAYYNSTFSGAI